jgi:hypothetical protein
MPYRILCNGVNREGVKARLDLASGLFCYVPLHKIRYGIQESVIYLVEQSQQVPAFWIHSRERTQEEESASLCRENTALKAENRELKTQLAQVLPV